MRIGINGRFLIAQQTGVQRVAFNLITSLIKIDRENEYFIFTGKGESKRPEWNYSNVQVITSRIREGETIRNLFWEQVTLPLLATRYHIDILHSPANMAPLFYRRKSIIHIHDLCFIVNPQWYSFFFRTWYNIVIPRLAKKATKVVTNSNNSRNDLLQHFNLSIEKVSLVYWAVDETFLANKEPQKNLSNPIDLDDYILYVGSLEPRKNIRVLIEAFERLRKSNPQIKTKLVLIGGESPLFANATFSITDYKEDIIFKGFVDESMLRIYYQNARLFVYPSLYEGFGLPPLEAMASGTAVVTSKTSSIPEVVGEAAIKVDPHSVSQLVSAMSAVLTDEKLTQDLVRKGYQQARVFNWYRVARNLLSLYYEVHCGDKKIPQEYWHSLREIEKRHILAHSR